MLRADDGTPFEVWRLEAVSPRARLLMCHGYYANRFQVLAIADELRQRGYEVLLMELRGHGQRPGPCTLGLQESRDAQTVLRWAAQRDAGRKLPIGALGLSMGAALVCQLAAQEPAVQAIVADSIYAQLLPVIQRVVRQRYHLPATPWTWLTWWSLQVMLGKQLAAIDPLALAPTMHQPLFAIYGGADQRVEPSSTEAFYRAWAGPKERWFDPAVAHVGMFRVHPHEYGLRVADFFDRTLRA